MRRASRTGFTLVELMLAVTLTGLVALLAHRLVVTAIASARALLEAREETDRDELGRRWLRRAFGSLEPGGEEGPFDGRPDQVEFTTWLPVAEGWSEQQRVTIQREGSRMIAHLAGGPIRILADSVAEVEFDYLLEPGADTRWVRVWQSPASAPLGVRCRVRRRSGGTVELDTMLYLIRERG